MKRIGVLLLAAVLAAGSVHAGNGRIGFSVGSGFEWIFDSMYGRESTGGSGRTNIMLTVNGSNSFGSRGGFGIEYGLGVIFPVNRWGSYGVQDFDFNEMNAGGFFFLGGIGYRYEASSLLGLSIGAGVHGSLAESRWSREMIAEGDQLPAVSVEYSRFELDIYGRAGVDFTLGGAFGIDLGVMVSTPVWSKLTEKASGSESVHDYGLRAVYFTPYAGLSYVY